MKIKLCGVRRVSDALLCAEAGADEVGVIFAKGSKRRVTLEVARAIRSSLPRTIGLVGVFDTADLDETLNAVELSAVQLHGPIPDQLPSLPIYVALHVTSAESLARINQLSFAARILLDSPKGGGSGHVFPWALARDARSYRPRQLFLAGGLTAMNVAEAIAQAQPDGVDVASGIEGPDGFKSPELVRAFVRAVREAKP